MLDGESQRVATVQLHDVDFVSRAGILRGLEVQIVAGVVRQRDMLRSLYDSIFKAPNAAEKDVCCGPEMS
jgi:hypothetical protein